MPRDLRLSIEPASSKTGKIFILLFTIIHYYSLFFFFSKIDFYVSGAIKVVLAQIQIYFKLNSGEQTSYCSVS